MGRCSNRYRNAILKFSVITFFMSILLPSSAFAWWNEEWPYRVPVSVEGGVNGASLTSVVDEQTILLRFHAGNFQDFFLIKEDLSDLRFIAGDDKTPLKFHVDSFDLINQLLFVWVKVPQVDPAISDKIWMYYGNAAAVPAEDMNGSYDASTTAVFHFNSEVASAEDATAYRNSGSIDDGVEVIKTSLIASGLKFSGTGSVNIPNSPTLRFNSAEGFYFSAWIKPLSKTTISSILSRTDESGDSLSLTIEDGRLTANIDSRTNPGMSIQAAVQITPETWQHVALSVNPGQAQLYVNGAVVAGTPVQNFEISGPIYLGVGAEFGSGYLGEMDEVTFASAGRSVDWVKLSAQNQGVQDSVVLLQPAEQLGSGGSDKGFFNVILSSTGESGWFIITLLMIMALISWVVMIGKFFYLRFALRDNKGFLAAYNKLNDADPSLLDSADTEEDLELADSPIMQAIFGKHDHFQSSPIYHLYHRGIKEVRQRIGGGVGAQSAGRLTPQAARAIRATLDAQMTREVQKLNAHMILLTIAVSGGPFLGLLGTVVGVMITFAAIAATGDVNIAAIAPGVAAALLTTVAGLFVAIPALFGYNYLSAKIKESVADMRVFNDEFVTRLAEFYSGQPR